MVYIKCKPFILWHQCISTLDEKIVIIEENISTIIWIKKKYFYKNLMNDCNKNLEEKW